MPNLSILDLNLEQERMPCCPLCDQPMDGAEPLMIGRVQSGGHAALALVHQVCAEEN